MPAEVAPVGIAVFVKGPHDAWHVLAYVMS